MYAAVIGLAYRPDRETRSQEVLVPGGKLGVWVAGLLGFCVTLGSMGLAMVPSEEVKSTLLFELSLLTATAVTLGIGLILYWRGAGQKVSTHVQRSCRGGRP